MEIAVLLFGPAARAASAHRVCVRCESQPRSQHLLELLADQCPALATMARSGRLAINSRFADPAQLILESDEVALVTMVSGG